MKTEIFAIFIIFFLILVIPTSYAQEDAKAKQKSVEVTISDTGNIHVKHVIFPSDSEAKLKLLDGTVKNLTITNEIGLPLMILGDGDELSVLPSENYSIVKYDLEDAVLLKDNVWTLNFFYLETTTFFPPKEADLIFVNNRPVYMGDKDAFACHGCQMILEYSIDEPKNYESVKWENKEFLVEIRSQSNIDNFIFDQSSKSITFDVSEKDRFVTTIIPLELLWGPYAVFLGDEKILFHDYINNGTHVWLNIKPNASGEISVIGTTVVPEFPIIAPLAMGFLIILVVPLIRKVNLH